MNTTHAIRQPEGFNASCGDCTTSCGQTIIPTGFQFYYASQSFYIRMRNTKKAIMTDTCASYKSIPNTCVDNCIGSGKQRVTTMPQFGGGISPHIGAVTQKQQLKDIKRSMRTFVRGAQMTSTSLIRANRPKYCGTPRMINKNTAGTFININRYNPRPVNQNQLIEQSCCSTSSVGTDKRGNNLPSICKNVRVCQDSCPE